MYNLQFDTIYVPMLVYITDCNNPYV